MARSRGALHRRRLTRQLQQFRSQSRLKQTDVAEQLDWSQSKVNRIENGEVSVRKTDLLALLSLYGVTDQETTRQLTEAARLARADNSNEYRDLLPRPYLRYLEFEELAVRVRHFDPLLVPGPLQTREYALAVLRAALRPEAVEAGKKEEIERTVDRLARLRLARKRLLLPDVATGEGTGRAVEPDELHGEFVLDESVLHRLVGGPEVMRAQVAHLRELAELPNVDIRVLPFAVGAHPGLGGGFVVLEFAGDEDPLLYIENREGDLTTREDPAKTGEYRTLFTELRSRAVDVRNFGAPS